MTRFKGIVFAFTDFGETADTLVLPQGMEILASTGNHFVGISLMPDIPDQPVMRCIKDVMKGEGQLDDTKTWSEVAAGSGDTVNEGHPYFMSQFLQLRYRQSSYICRGIDRVKQSGSFLRCCCMY